MGQPKGQYPPYGSASAQYNGYSVIEMDKPESDNRIYASMQLTNGLEVLLIHDPSTAHAAAALTVGVGYFNDPDDMPGLAHLCEHVLPRSSNESDHFFKYIRNYAGSANSFTFADCTSYYFSLGANTGHFDEAVQRFSACFQNVQIKDDCVTSELSAVDGEYESNSQSDFHRIFELFKTQTLPKHPWSKFGIGNEKSLTQDGRKSGKVLASDLYKWWKKHYSASIMGLVVLSYEPMEHLADLVKNNFSNIPTSDTPLSVATIPWGPEQHGRITFAKTNKNTSTIEVSFCLPDQDDLYESKPAIFVSRLIKHRGPNSLYSQLKESGWIVRLFSDPYQPARGFSFFPIKAELTSRGLECYPLVLDTIYGYLRFLSHSDLSGLFEEFKALQNVRFNYSEKPEAKSSVNHLSKLLLTKWPKERLLKGPTGVWKQDNDALHGMLVTCLAPKAASVILSSSNLALISKTGPWMKETWYGTEYMGNSSSPEVSQNATAPNITQRTSLPSLNRFIPTELSLKSISQLPDTENSPPPLEESGLEPLHSSNKSTIWFKRDVDSHLPKGYIGVFIRSPVARRSDPDDDPAVNTIMTKLVEMIVGNALAVEFYDALEAGLRFALIYDDDGNLILQTSGYTDKMLSLLEQLLRKLTSYVISEQSFLTYKAELTQGYHNQQLDSPLLLSHRMITYGLRNFEWTPEEMEKAIKNPNAITLEKLQIHLKKLLGPTRTKILVVGNFNESDARDVQESVDGILKSTDEPDPEDIVTRIPTRENWVFFQSVANKEERDHAVGYYLQIIPSASNRIKTYATLLLFAMLVDYPFYEQLRMNERLGYEVLSAPLIHKSVVGMLFTVQGRQPTTVIEARIDNFLEGFKEYLNGKDISETRSTLVQKLEEKAENMEKRSAQLATFILGNSSGCCLSIPRHSSPSVKQLLQSGSNEEELIDTVKSLAEEDIVKFYENYIRPTSTSRAKLSIHAQSNVADRVPSTADSSHYAVIQDLKQFKQKQDAAAA